MTPRIPPSSVLDIADLPREWYASRGMRGEKNGTSSRVALFPFMKGEDGEFVAGEKDYRVLDGLEWNEFPY